MTDRGTEQLLIGALMRNPSVLLQKDKYQLDTSDFEHSLYQYAFYAIANMVQDGIKGAVPAQEIENWLGKESRGKDIYEGTSGRQTLVDALSRAEDTGHNFESLYEQLKKENLIRDLQKANFNTNEFLVDNAKTDEDKIKNDKYNSLRAGDILTSIEDRLLKVKTKYLRGDSSESQTLYEGLEELILSLKESPEIGMPLQGDIFNYVTSGAITGRFYLRSGSSGLGKSRSAMADACYIAFPLRYDWNRGKWISCGHGKKVLFVVTEQEIHEFQKMAVAYISGINERVFKQAVTNQTQDLIIKQAFKIFQKYQHNFHIVRAPSPNITVIKQLIREHVMLHNIKYVWYDYIFESPSLFSEFKGMNLRTDQMLFMFSDAMKNLAVELDIFVMSSTQVNSNSDNSKDIRNEASIAGSRAVINKADMGCIMARPLSEELKALKETTNIHGIPNVVTDIYKNRGGEYTYVRIWSQIDLGTLRKKDLFITDSHLGIIQIPKEDYENSLVTFNTDEEIEEVNELINELNGERI